MGWASTLLPSAALTLASLDLALELSSWPWHDAPSKEPVQLDDLTT